MAEKVAVAMHHIAISGAGVFPPGTELSEAALNGLNAAQRERLFSLGALRMEWPMMGGSAREVSNPQTFADLKDGGEQTGGLPSRSSGASTDETEPTGREAGGPTSGEQTGGLPSRSSGALEEETEPTGREAGGPTSGEQTGGLPSRSSGASIDETEPTPEEIAAFLGDMPETDGVEGGKPKTPRKRKGGESE